MNLAAPPRHVGVVGAGWSGLAAAVEAVSQGHRVTLFDMASQPGGRARRVQRDGWSADNGQHILIGAYTQTLALMRTVGVDPDAVLRRTPLCLLRPDGSGLRLAPGRAAPAFVRAVLGYRGWSWRERVRLLAAAANWRLQGFRCDPELSVGQLCARLPQGVRDELIEPLCVAALNTPIGEASAGVFLRVLKDALGSGPGSADLLLPRCDLSALLPEPTLHWLRGRGAEVRLARRVETIRPRHDDWEIDGEAVDAVVLATPAGEAARLAEDSAPQWAATARALRYQPIITVYVDSAGTRLPAPMLSLPAIAGESAPAQFVFDLGQLGQRDGLLAFVISAAAPWVDQGVPATVAATLRQAERSLGSILKTPPQALRALTEKRATFACTPGLTRPAQRVAPGLVAAGDYVNGPYPATLEGAVRSGHAAIRALA